MSHDIFISYSRRDTERMQQVRDGLREAGLTVWTDEGIEPGTESWKRAISDAITECTSVVVLFSPDAAKSTWVNRELDFAELHNKKIYPLLVRGDERSALPFGYTTFQFIDIRSNDALENGIADLISILSKAYPTRNLRAKAHPKISQAENITEVTRLSEPVMADTRSHWIRYQSDVFMMFVPAAFKMMTPTHEAVARMFLLHESVENIENLMLQFINDERNFVQIAAGLPFTTPNTSITRETVFVDVSGLSVLSGFVNVIKFPVLNRDWFFGRIMMNQSLTNLSDYMKTYQAIETGRWTLRKHGAITAVVEHQIDEHIVIHYFVIPFGNKIVIHALFIVEQQRYERDKTLLEQIAQSIQLM